MATAFTITKEIADLQAVFDKVKRVFYDSSTNLNITSATTIGFELPVIEDSFSFDSGAASISVVKLTTGQQWASYSTAGDPDISMQVASVDSSIVELFTEKKGNALTATDTSSTLNGLAFSGQGYSTEIKKVTGTLILASEDGTRLIELPNVEMFANFVMQTGTPGYFNVQIVPKPNTDGANIILLTGATPPIG